MSNFNELKAIREALGFNQKRMGEFVGVEAESAQSAWQRWESDPSKPSARKALEKAKEAFQVEKGFPWVPSQDARVSLTAMAMKAGMGDQVYEPTQTYVTTALPGENVAKAWRILHEAARAGGADLMAMDVDAVAEILGSIAEAVAMGRGEEARLRLVRRAEILLKAVGKAAP